MDASLLTMAVLVAVLLVIVGGAVKLFDLKRAREAAAVQLQAQVSDALLRDPELFGLAVTPTAHVPYWAGTPVRIEVTGQVPTADLREHALRAVSAEAARVRTDLVIEDRLHVVSTAVRAA
jgi:hypothetical protein